MIKELTEIRNELLLGVESKDLLYIKMQINKLDTLIYKSSSVNKKKGNLNYYCDNKRHLVCYPYSKSNLHKMAIDLNIKVCWFHKDHYDIPKKRAKEIMNKCILISPREILQIINKSDN